MAIQKKNGSRKGAKAQSSDYEPRRHKGHKEELSCILATSAILIGHDRRLSVLGVLCGSFLPTFLCAFAPLREISYLEF
jgi:hypothetical protein